MAKPALEYNGNKTYATNTERAMCKRCGHPIRFKQLPNGRWKPINIDGSEHYADCVKNREVTVTKDGETKTVRATVKEYVPPPPLPRRGTSR